MKSGSVLVLFAARVSLAALAVACEARAAESSFFDDFEAGADQWFPSDPTTWRITETPEGLVYHLLKPGAYRPPFRSPFSVSLLPDRVWGDFTLTARVKTLQNTRGHRDMCVIFGYQDPAHFYYVHLGEKPDPHSSQIFIVNGADRTKITTSPDTGIPWREDTWHQIKVVRKAEKGTIEIFFDDLDQPQKIATDTTFGWGLIGIGSFDDMGQWDDLRINGTPVTDRTATLFAPTKAPAPTAAIPPQKSAATALTFTKWSGDLNVPDPVAISLDDQGRVYATQTQRRQIQDLDIRRSLDWIPDDVGLRSVEEKLALYHERLAPERSAENVTRVEDLNHDGSHDYRDLQVLSEKVHRIEDTDHDGKADSVQVFAEGFQTEVTGIAAGVLWKDGAVYATIAPDVWKLIDADGDGKAERRDVFAHGFGHHIAYAGHDMHGLTAGPDGKIYWTIGDKGISVTTQEGQTFSYPNEGGVLRANPDGSGFEVFAHGLRNVQELAFDEFGNLFGVDNDSDQPGEKERFVYIVEGMDAGWRCSYQYRGKDYNPWTAEHLWKPRREEHPAYLLPPLSNYVDGPCGFTYNPGTALDASWQRTFFLTEAPGGKQWAFQVEPDGPAFRMTNSRQIGAGIAFTGWKFGPDGALYGADWGATAYPMDKKGAVWTIDVPVAQRSPEREETRQLLGSRWEETNETKLQGLLGHADQRVRLKAQFEIVRRNAPTLLQTVLAAPDAPRLARIHAIWGLGQLRDSAAIASTLVDSDPAIRAQAAKTLGQIPLPLTPEFDLGRLASLLRDADPQVRFHAAMALGKLGSPGSAVLPAVLEFIDSEPAHPYFRLAQSRALGAVATTDALARLAEDSSPAQRLAAVLALRERRAPEIAKFLSDATPAVRDEAALAIHDGDSIPEAIPALAASLAVPGNHAERFIRRAINANFRVGTPEAAERVALYALLPDAPAPLRAEALNALLAWLAPPPLDRVDGWRRHLASRDSQSIGAALTKPVNELLDSPENDVLEKAVQLASSLQIPLDPARLDALLHNEAAPPGVRVAALENIKSAPAIAYSLASTAAELRICGAALLASSDPKAARPYLAETLQRKDATIAERQAAFALLAELKAEDVLKPWADRLTAGDLPSALWLDVAEAAEKAGLAANLPRPAADPLSAWIECLEGGDPARGEDIFRNNIAAQCVACHKADDSKGGSLIGPNVKSVGLRDRRYLLESLTMPQASIAKGYGTITLTLTDGSVTGGQLRGETAKGIELRDPANHGSQVIPLEKIRERGAVISLMPPMGLILPKRDVRDLVSYLSTLRAK